MQKWLKALQGILLPVKLIHALNAEKIATAYAYARFSLFADICLIQDIVQYLSLLFAQLVS